MTNKLVVIINSLKVTKIKKILLYEMKFLVPNYSCLQIRGLPPPDPHSLCPLSSTEFVEPPSPPRKKILGTPLRLSLVLFDMTHDDALMIHYENQEQPMHAQILKFSVL